MRRWIMAAILTLRTEIKCRYFTRSLRSQRSPKTKPSWLHKVIWTAMAGSRRRLSLSKILVQHQSTSTIRGATRFLKVELEIKPRTRRLSRRSSQWKCSTNRVRDLIVIMIFGAMTVSHPLCPLLLRGSEIQADNSYSRKANSQKKSRKK